jgi:hypothetical protein
VPQPLQFDISYFIRIPLFIHRNLISLDLWRCKFAKIDVLDALAENCHQLEELDIGWWSVYKLHNLASETIQSSCAGRLSMYV